MRKLTHQRLENFRDEYAAEIMIRDAEYFAAEFTISLHKLPGLPGLFLQLHCFGDGWPNVQLLAVECSRRNLSVEHVLSGTESVGHFIARLERLGVEPAK